MKDWMLPTFLAVILWGFWAFLPKIAVKYIEPESALVYQVIGGVIFGLVILVKLKFQLSFNIPGVVFSIVIGFIGFFGAYMYNVALSKGPLALVAPISALYPILAILLGLLFLQEPITARQGFGIFLSFVAIILIAT